MKFDYCESTRCLSPANKSKVDAFLENLNVKSACTFVKAECECRTEFWKEIPLNSHELIEISPCKISAEFDHHFITTEETLATGRS